MNASQTMDSALNYASTHTTAITVHVILVINFVMSPTSNVQVKMH